MMGGGEKGKGKKVFGDAGYRSRYLSHAKRALYHLSYTPYMEYQSTNCGGGQTAIPR